MDNIRLIFIVERGVLEQQTIWSLKSIRKFGDSMANCHVTCYSPRALFYPSKSTVKTLEALGASVVLKDLNKSFKYYALANKPLVLKEVAESYSEEYIVFLDSDTLVFQNFHSLLSGSFDIAAAPVFEQGIGVLHSDDENGFYWDSISRHIGLSIDNLPLVTTGVKKKSIRAYYNTGVIAFSKNVLAQLSSIWITLIDYAISNKILPTSGIYFVEQSTFSLTVHSMGLNIKTLPNYYNFPVITGSEDLFKSLDFNQVLLVHHQGNIELLLSLLQEEHSENDKYYWFVEQYSQYSTSHKFFNKLWRWRRNLVERLIYIIQDRRKRLGW